MYEQKKTHVTSNTLINYTVEYVCFLFSLSQLLQHNKTHHLHQCDTSSRFICLSCVLFLIFISFFFTWTLLFANRKLISERFSNSFVWNKNQASKKNQCVHGEEEWTIKKCVYRRFLHCVTTFFLLCAVRTNKAKQSKAIRYCAHCFQTLGQAVLDCV